MDKSGFEQSWLAFATAADSLDDQTIIRGGQGDIAHLISIGAHKDLIKIAKNRFNVGEFSIAPTEKDRKSSPDWMFKNSLPLAADGLGNHALWMDVARMDSLILFVCHDPPEVFVLSKNPTDFFNNIRDHLVSNEKNNLHDVLYDYLEVWTDKTNSFSSLKYKKDSDRDIFDFNIADIGDSVALNNRGNRTVVSEGLEPGVLILSSENEDMTNGIKRRNQKWAIGTILLVSAIFIYFYAVQDNSMLASIGFTFLSLLMISGIMTMLVDEYYIWQEKRKNKS